MKIKKKIIKNFFVQHFLAFITFLYIKLVSATSVIVEKNTHNPEYYWNNNKPFILAFWHSQLMMISFCWKSNTKINILASGHSDGRFGAIVGNYFKLNNIQTFSTEKSISLKPIFKLLKNSNYIGITPDGPRGPNKKVSDGIIKISKTTQVPIIPVGYASSKFNQLKSWDSFLITKPFSKCAFVWGESISIPKNCTENEIEELKNKLEIKINNCVDLAKKEINA
ncbi:MAG: lysophospholipid acyltransferase family protein [Pelagibacteraceae bacterium]|nr:lysophospholipid acyltransferase family protein [Pelagibacteraceae bacterium]